MSNDNNEIRNNIDNLFHVDQPPEEKPKQIPQFKTNTLQDVNDIEFATGKALEEMEQVRQGFLDFQESISDCVVAEYLYNELEEFANACMDMVELLKDDIKSDKLNSIGRAYYEKMQEYRMELLYNVFNKYGGRE